MKPPRIILAACKVLYPPAADVLSGLDPSDRSTYHLLYALIVVTFDVIVVDQQTQGIDNASDDMICTRPSRHRDSDSQHLFGGMRVWVMARMATVVISITHQMRLSSAEASLAS